MKKIAKKSKSGRKLGEVSLTILAKIFEFGKDAVVDLIETYKYDEFVRLRLYKYYDNLHRAGYIEKKQMSKNQSFFHLTPKGRLQVLKYLHLEKLKANKWDKHWRVVIFDIPESLKKWREYLRRDLKNLGFVPLQESVYITPYPVTGELHEMLEEWGLRKYFRYLTVTEIDGVEELKEMFDVD